MILMEISTWQLDRLDNIIPIKIYVRLVQIILVTCLKCSMEHLLFCEMK